MIIKYINTNKVDKHASSLIYEGINYKVYINNEDLIVKQYSFENQYEMRELTKTIDLECYLISLSNIFIGPSHFEIKDNILYLAYTQQEVLKKFIGSNTIVCETDLDEQELYNELVGDDENIYEQDVAEYIK